MAIDRDDLTEKIKAYMLENGLGYMHINAMINVHKDIKISFVEDKEDQNHYNFGLN